MLPHAGGPVSPSVYAFTSHLANFSLAHGSSPLSRLRIMETDAAGRGAGREREADLRDGRPPPVKRMGQPHDH